MSILKQAIDANKTRFLEAVGKLEGMQLCTFMLSCLKEDGDSATQYTIDDLFNDLPREKVKEIINLLEKIDDTIQVQRETVPDESAVPELSDGKRKGRKKIKMRYY